MPTLQLPGIGSGLDVNSLVTQLVAAERAPHQTLITRREATATVQLSALSTLKGALASFKNTLEPLRKEDAFAPRAAASSNSDVFTATAGSAAATGSYDIEVVALAKAQQLASGAFVGGSTAEVGTGELTIAFGDEEFTVTIDASSNTLAGIRDAINKASDNPGVQATLLNESGGTRLVLTSSKTGAANAVEVTQSGGDGGLEQITYGPSNTTHMTVVQAAQDAHIRIATFDHFSDTNVIDEAIDGVTITLKAVSPQNDEGEAQPATLSVSQDTTLLKSRINTFVQQYNSLQKSMAGMRTYNAATRVAGPLLGDALLRGIESQINLDLTNPVSGLTGSYTTLAAIGITKQVDGSLAVDDTKLSDALAANTGAVAKIFGSENGVAARLFTHIDEHLKSNGAIDARNQSLQKSLDTVKKDTEALEARMAVVEARYRRQFTALDVMLAQMQTTSSYLGSQLEGLQNLSNSR